MKMRGHEAAVGDWQGWVRGVRRENEAAMLKTIPGGVLAMVNRTAKGRRSRYISVRARPNKERPSVVVRRRTSVGGGRECYRRCSRVRVYIWQVIERLRIVHLLGIGLSSLCLCSGILGG